MSGAEVGSPTGVVLLDSHVGVTKANDRFLTARARLNYRLLTALYIALRLIARH